MSQISFTVTIPTDGGFVGRECNEPSCRRYFQIHADSVKTELSCPYCASTFPNDQLHTAAQAKHIRRQAEEQATEFVHSQVNKMFAGLARQFGSSGAVTFHPSTSRYRAKPVTPAYREQKVDSELVCPSCSCRFQVFGIFGYCPGCREENMLIYEANISILRREITEDSGNKRALRRAYTDLVSTFEIFCRRKASRFPVPTKKPSFQRMRDAREFFSTVAGVDIFAGLDASADLALRRVFGKRHLYQHSDGNIDARYVEAVPEDASLLGRAGELSLEEFNAGADALRRVLDALVQAVHAR
jgi:hypothetical protein